MERYEEGSEWAFNIIDLPIDKIDASRIEGRIVDKDAINRIEQLNGKNSCLVGYDITYLMRGGHTISFNRGFHLVRVAHPDREVVERLSQEIQKAIAIEAAYNVMII